MASPNQYNQNLARQQQWQMQQQAPNMQLQSQPIENVQQHHQQAAWSMAIPQTPGTFSSTSSTQQHFQQQQHSFSTVLQGGQQQVQYTQNVQSFQQAGGAVPSIAAPMGFNTQNLIGNAAEAMQQSMLQHQAVAQGMQKQLLGSMAGMFSRQPMQVIMPQSSSVQLMALPSNYASSIASQPQQLQLAYGQPQDLSEESESDDDDKNAAAIHQQQLLEKEQERAALADENERYRAQLAAQQEIMHRRELEYRECEAAKQAKELKTKNAELRELRERLLSPPLPQPQSQALAMVVPQSPPGNITLDAAAFRTLMDAVHRQQPGLAEADIENLISQKVAEKTGALASKADLHDAALKVERCLARLSVNATPKEVEKELDRAAKKVARSSSEQKQLEAPVHQSSVPSQQPPDAIGFATHQVPSQVSSYVSKAPLPQQASYYARPEDSMVSLARKRHKDRSGRKPKAILPSDDPITSYVVPIPVALPASGVDRSLAKPDENRGRSSYFETASQVSQSRPAKQLEAPPSIDQPTAAEMANLSTPLQNQWDPSLVAGNQFALITPLTESALTRVPRPGGEGSKRHRESESRVSFAPIQDNALVRPSYLEQSEQSAPSSRNFTAPSPDNALVRPGYHDKRQKDPKVIASSASSSSPLTVELPGGEMTRIPKTATEVMAGPATKAPVAPSRPKRSITYGGPEDSGAVMEVGKSSNASARLDVTGSGIAPSGRRNAS